MRNKQVSWKFILCIMGSGMVTCMLILFILYKQRGYLKNTDIIGVIVAFTLSCLILSLTHRFLRQDINKKDSP